MDKEKRKKITWIVIIVLVILGLLWWLLRGTDIYNPPTNDMTNQVIEIPIPSANFQYDPARPPAQTDTEFSVESLAKSFAERFGSWSTDNLGKNLEELLPLSTLKMQNYLNGIEITKEEGVFTGISTKSISTEIISLGDTNAEVMVSTQRVETDSSLQERTFYQDIKVTLVKPDDKWLVDGAYWQ